MKNNESIKTEIVAEVISVNNLEKIKISFDNLCVYDRKYRYNPLPKKWEPSGGWRETIVNTSYNLTDDDFAKLQAYATKLSWLRDPVQGGYEFIKDRPNYLHQNRGEIDSWRLLNFDDAIYMNKEQAEKWLDMLNKGEV